MSALPLKADMCGAASDVGFGPIADITAYSITSSQMSALGQKPTCAPQKAMSALPPIATAKADMPQITMSALPPKADM
jgi:hypothetical protein